MHQRLVLSKSYSQRMGQCFTFAMVTMVVLESVQGTYMRLKRRGIPTEWIFYQANALSRHSFIRHSSRIASAVNISSLNTLSLNQSSCWFLIESYSSEGPKQGERASQHISAWRKRSYTKALGFVGYHNSVSDIAEVSAICSSYHQAAVSTFA